MSGLILLFNFAKKNDANMDRLIVNVVYFLFYGCILIIIGCKKDDGRIGAPFKLYTLEEITSSDTIKRTSQILSCRLDDEFYFNDANKLKVFMGSDKCSLDPKNSVGGIWELMTIDSMQGEFLKLNIIPSYIVHDSLRVSQTTGQWLDNNKSQFYKVVAFNDSVIIIQNGKGLVLPITQNTWQLTLKKG